MGRVTFDEVVALRGENKALKDRIALLEEVITDMPQVIWAFDVSEYGEKRMPQSDRMAAVAWLHCVNIERDFILKGRTASEG